jgi:hypothetical protein
MPDLDPRGLFTFLGPLFLVLGMIRAWRAGELVPQARTWLLLGVIFSAVAAWLWWTLRTVGAP